MNGPPHLPSHAITTPDYWERAWELDDVPDAIDPGDVAPENHYFRVLHTLFERQLGTRCAPGARLIEIGCGGSRWLPYFHQAFGYDVAGIDYTVSGIRLARSILDKGGVTARIVHGDLFEPPPDWIEQFDVVVSFGLIEHFENPSDVLSACGRYLRPGGRMFTLVPTMRGLYGLSYRLLRPAVYRKHVPHSRELLVQEHTAAGLRVAYGGYLLGMPGLLTAPVSPGVVGRMAFAFSRWYWRLESAGYGVRPNRFTSPYAVCVATKPD